MPDLVYLIGEPGSGKSTALELITRRLTGAVIRKPFAHTEWWVPGDRRVIELGYRRPAFSGTDTLSMSVQPLVVKWLSSTVNDAVIGEGDRLANGKFFQAVVDAGWNLTVILLDVTEEIGAARRAARALALGGEPQGDTWVRGRRTKVARLAADWPHITVDANRDAHEVARLLAAVEAPPLTLLTSHL